MESHSGIDMQKKWFVLIAILITIGATIHVIFGPGSDKPQFETKFSAMTAADILEFGDKIAKCGQAFDDCMSVKHTKSFGTWGFAPRKAVQDCLAKSCSAAN